MIGTTARIALGLIVGAAMLVVVAMALFADLIAPETRPTLRRPCTLRRQANRSLVEART